MSRAEQAAGAQARYRRCRDEQSKQWVLGRGVGGSRDAPEITAHDGDRGTGFSVDCAGKGGRFERKAAAGELGSSTSRR